ncbi:MAG TPA: hypothetical protein VMH40_21195 [Myxococcaceae bacterium]|nr:hypothetical protein [Myxococcaceae bacterium]
MLESFACRHAVAGALAGVALLSAAARAASGSEWLSSTQGPSPIVTAKSGTGTAQATATAKVTSDSIQTFCGDQAGQGDPAQARSAIDACAKQQRSELGKTYTIQADCTAGKLQPLDGATYVLDGLWDNSDVGAGRTRWRGPSGVVGRDSASGGLALSQQWEVLCPGRVSASVISKARSLSPSGVAGGTGGAAAPAAPASVCNGDPNCTEVAAFGASVVEFRASLQGNYKTLTITLRFQNKLSRPLILGYIPASGGATDDRGNRYIVRDQDTRGIGYIHGRGNVDDKFQIAPGQTADARFLLIWGGQQLFGNTFDLDLTVREIVPAGNGQSTLGPEYPLQIVGLVDGAKAGAPVAQAGGASPSGAAAPAAAPVTTSSTSMSPTAPAAPSAPASPLGLPTTAAVPGTGGARCAAGTSCYDAGSFTVTVMNTAAAVSGRNLVVRFGVRVKNQTTQPLVLAYKGGSNAAVDEQGNSYGWGRPGSADASAQGIGTLQANRIDPQFQVAAGATRDAQFLLTRFDTSNRPAGKSFTLDTVLVELRAANAQQWQKVREYPVHLPGVGAGTVPAVGQSPQSPNDGVKQASDLLKGLLGK